MAGNAAVYDVRGKLVASILDGELAPGLHRIVWDGKDRSGNDVKQGVYFCRISAGDEVEVRKMVALR
jgi:flagellar hook assembly protein FlgD